MATQDYAASVQGVAIRVTRLDAAGNLLTGAGDSYTTSAFMRVSFTPEYEEGDEIVEKSANGVICVSYKAPDTLKRITMEVAICEPDPELTSLMSGGLLLRKTVSGTETSVGWAAPGVGDDPAGNGVAIEVWSFAVKDGKRAATLPYFYWVFPYVRLRQSGDRVIENGMLASTFEGYGLGNTTFEMGPDGRWEWPMAAERPYSYARTSWAPTGLKGFYQWYPVSTKSLTNKALTSDLATLTASSHGFSVGQTVAITNVDSTFNGTYTISATTAHTFSYAKVATGVTSTATTTGTATRGPGYSVVSSLDSGTSVATVTNKVLTSNVATLTTQAVHGFVVGQEVFVTGVGSPFDGAYNVASVPTTTTFTYTRVADNVTTTSVSSTSALVQDAYNVPGNINYNADLALDNIVGSTAG
jgi:hypothetical protein